jgi:MFS family permease
MAQSNAQTPATPHLIRSLAALIVGSLLLRAAAGAMGENIQFYFNAIHEAALNPNHPLRFIAGAHQVYEVSYTIGGLIIGMFFAAELIGAPLFGAWSDKYGRKLFIIFGPLFGAIAVQITAMTTIVWLLLFTRLLEGVSTAANAPATLGYIAETTSHSPKLRARVVGFFEIATIGGMALGFALGGWLWRHFGTPAYFFGIPLTSPAFALNALVYLASLVILWFGLHEYREVKQVTHGTTVREALASYWKLFTNPRVQSFAPAWIAINAVLGVWINLTARIFTDKSRFSDQLLVGRFDSFEAGNLRAGYAIIFVLGILVWSMFFGQWRKTTVMLIGTGGLFLTCLFLFALNHQPALDAPFVLPLAVLLVGSIVIQSGFTPAALAHLADITEDHSTDRGAIMGMYSVFLGVGQFIGATVGGPFVDWRGADGIVIVTALFGVISVATLLRLHFNQVHKPIIQGEKVKAEG